MVRFAARHEYARTVEDVLARRIRLLFTDAALAASLATEVGELLRAETGVDPQAAAFRELAASYLQMDGAQGGPDGPPFDKLPRSAIIAGSPFQASFCPFEATGTCAEKAQGVRGDGGPKTAPMSCRIVLQGAFGSSWEYLK